MKMFLVVMCDIFLILYLTAVSHISDIPASELTVADYEALKTSEEKFRLLLEERKEKLALTERLLIDVEERIEAETREKREIKDKYDELEQKAAESEEAVRKKEEEFLNAVKQLAALKKEERSVRDKLREQQELTAEVKKAKLSALEEARKIRENYDKTVVRGEELKIKLAEVEQSNTELDQVLEELEQKEQEVRLRAQKAEEDAALSKKIAAQAAEREKLALEKASDATDLAISSKVEALRAKGQVRQVKKQIEIVHKEVTKTKGELKAVTQPAKKAYQVNLQSRLVLVEIQYRSRNLLIGSTKDKISFRGIPVRSGSERIVFLPVSQMELGSRDSPDSFKYYRIKFGDKSARSLYVSPRSPDVVGIILPDGHSVQGAPFVDRAELSQYMPTLFAVRNGSRMGFSDRIRSLDKDFFLFKRDRLASEATGDLIYQGEGFRGSGDYGERIVPGDNIVDLKGAFIGIALTENKIRPIRNLSKWKKVDITTEDADKFISEIFE